MRARLVSLLAAVAWAACASHPEVMQGGPDAGGGPRIDAGGLTDEVAPSPDPPGGLTPAQVPQFVSLGFDDNFQSDAILWVTATLRAKQVHASFYLSSVYITEDGATEAAALVKQAWHEALVDGNEIADHTHTHSDGAELAFTLAQWTAEIQTCLDWITKPFDPAEADADVSNPARGIGAVRADIVGFRTPYLAYTDATFTALKDLGFWYDCSIEEGWDAAHDGTNYPWPYTMANHKGLWELPVYAVIVPPDDKAMQYGVPPGLRAKLKGVDSSFDTTSGKITGLDYNMWILYRMTKAEFLATLKYTLDLHLMGNRTPMMLGAHPDLYSTQPSDPPVPNATWQERRAALEEFLDYALSKPEVRVATNRAILDWLRNPTPL